MTLDRTAMAAACAWLAVLGATTTARGQCLVEHLFASDGAAADSFGYSVAIDGNTAVVGAVADDTTPGSAYVFVRSGGVWTQQAHLFASDGAADDQLGFSVAISGDTAVVGANWDDTSAGANAGSVFIFVRSGGVWTQQAQLFASDGAAFDAFGTSVAISGDTAVVGALGDNTPIGTNAGSAYVFVRDSEGVWTEQAHLFASDGAAFDELSRDVAISSDTVVVGAYKDDTPGGTDAGSAYVFVRDSEGVWTEQAHLFASDGAPGEWFGYAVAISGGTAVVGAPVVDTPGGANAGSAYVFVRSGGAWTEEAHVFAVGDATSHHFGVSVAISGDTAVVGAFGEVTPGGTDAGSAYVLVRSGGVWTGQAHLFAPDGAPDDWFGFDVDLSGDTAVVGASNDDTLAGTDAGSAYVFDLAANPPPGDCNLDCQVNLADYAGSPACMSGPQAPSGAGCECYDLDDDTDADLLDFAELQNAFGAA